MSTQLVSRKMQNTLDSSSALRRQKLCFVTVANATSCIGGRSSLSGGFLLPWIYDIISSGRSMTQARHGVETRNIETVWRSQSLTDKVRNPDIRQKTGLHKSEFSIKEKLQRWWLGHVLRMEDSRIPHQATHWELGGYKRKPGRPRKNWMDIVRRDMMDKDTNLFYKNVLYKFTFDMRHLTYLGRSRRTGGQEDRIASTCGPMHPS